MSVNVYGEDGFCCPRESRCAASATFNGRTGERRPDVSFWRGQLSHVGHHYDLVDDGKEWRVLVLGMETGRARENVSLSERRLEQLPVIDSAPRTRKPHMKGTASALRLAFGRNVGADRDGELLRLENESRPVHLMDAYALVNIRLCSAVVTGTTSSRGTRVMTENCLPHLAATMRILEPTLCVLQSSPAREQLAPVLSNVQRIAPNLEYVSFAGVPLYLASFVHPHQQGGNARLNWGRSFSTPYLDEVVAPTLRTARELALA